MRPRLPCSRLLHDHDRAAAHPCAYKQPAVRIYPVFFLHSILLPINPVKLAQIQLSSGNSAGASGEAEELS
jgi:hypothetical protein